MRILFKDNYQKTFIDGLGIGFAGGIVCAIIIMILVNLLA